MEIYVLDSKLRPEYVIDKFHSLIWTERFYEAGDFELKMPADEEDLSHLHLGGYLSIRQSERFMIIEKIEILTDIDSGNSFTITGRSAESVLDRRVIAKGILELDISYRECLRRILTENIFTTVSGRVLSPRIIAGNLNGSSKLGTEKMDAAYYGENVYDETVNLLKQGESGMRMEWVEQPSNDAGGYFRFVIYGGADRSYNQSTNPYVVFSPKYDNLLNTSYVESDIQQKTCVYLYQDMGEEADPKILVYNPNDKVGYSRREMYLETHVDKEDEEGNAYTDAQIEAFMIQEAKNALADIEREEMFDGELEAGQQFVYGEDFYLGDIVQIINEYGREACARVEEVVRSWDVDGFHLIPTFVAIKS